MLIKGISDEGDGEEVVLTRVDLRENATHKETGSHAHSHLST